MDRLRSTLLESKTLEACQEADDLLAGGTPLQHLLSTLHACAACVNRPDSGTAPGLVFLYNLDRSVDELERLGLLRPALHAAVGFVSRHGFEPIEPATPGEVDVASLPQDLADGDVARLARALRALEDPRSERAARAALLDVTRHARGPFGHRLVDVAAFLRAFERSDAHDRAVLAHAYARELVQTNAEAHEAAPAPLPAASDAPLPGTASAGELLAHLRSFHRPAAHACLHALVQAGRDEEALTVLLTRAEENAGPRWRNLLFADAVRETFALHGDARDELLGELTELLLRSEPDAVLVEHLADGVADEPLRARERKVRSERLADGIGRRDREAAIEAAGALLADEDGGERVRHAVLSAVLEHEDAHTPHAFAAVSSLLAIARSVGWPAARASLLRAVHLVTVEREP